MLLCFQNESSEVHVPAFAAGASASLTFSSRPFLPGQAGFEAGYWNYVLELTLSLASTKVGSKSQSHWIDIQA